MIHPATELRKVDDVVGYGVFATQPIPRGTIVSAVDEFDIVLPPAAVLALPPPLRAVMDRYAYEDSHGNHVLHWDFTRFINHSCDPTSRSVGATFDIAVRDIVPGEQLTCEYAALNLTETLSFTCHCGTAKCRGRVGPSDVESFWKEWDCEVNQAFTCASRVAQPLLPVAQLHPSYHVLVDAIRSGTAVALPSCRQRVINTASKTEADSD
jgi:uncharacterized protein